MKSQTRFRWIPLLLPLAVLCLLTAAPQPALAQDVPTLAKDSIVVRAQTTWIEPYPKPGPGSSKWRPEVWFTLFEPIHSASVFSVEVGFPGREQWLELGCGRDSGDEYEATNRVLLCTGAGDAREAVKEYVAFAGIVDFSIHVRNELQGTDATLFQGKFKVSKQPAKRQPEVVYYVDEDWRLPIGYIYLRRNSLHATLSFRASVGSTTCYLFYQGKELDHGSWHGGTGATHSRARVEKCQFKTVTPSKENAPGDASHMLNEKPGEYEIKVLADGRLARSVKFTVDANGSFDNGIATANKLGSDRVIVPVKVIGDQDGVWNKLAWKTDAFYGNPLTGFTAPP